MELGFCQSRSGTAGKECLSVYAHISALCASESVAMRMWVGRVWFWGWASWFLCQALGFFAGSSAVPSTKRQAVVLLQLGAVLTAPCSSSVCVWCWASAEQVHSLHCTWLGLCAFCTRMPVPVAREGSCFPAGSWPRSGLCNIRWSAGLLASSPVV